MRKIKYYMFLILITSFMNNTKLFTQELSEYNFDKPNFSIELDKDLKEISGLTLDNNDRLFAHDDETSEIYELNPSNGKIIKSFQVGDKKIKDDFEDIAFADGIFYLLNSKGDLFAFEEGKDEEEVNYQKIDIGLKSKFDTEGLCYDKSLNSLLIAAKESSKKNKNVKSIFRFDLEKMKLDEKPFINIDLEKIKSGKKKTEFKPSAIIKNIKNNNYYILGGKKLCIVEININSEIINQIELEEKYHYQPEGMVILKSGELLISDEAEKKHAKLTSYKIEKGN